VGRVEEMLGLGLAQIRNPGNGFSQFMIPLKQIERPTNSRSVRFAELPGADDIPSDKHLALLVRRSRNGATKSLSAKLEEG
jgi:hypothetical protein